MPVSLSDAVSGDPHDIHHDEKSGEDQGSKSVKTGQGERVGYGGKRHVFRLERKESREVYKTENFKTIL